MVQVAVNRGAYEGLSEHGEVALSALLARVRAGYRPDWFHQVEHLTIDHVGYVYWKGHQIEHYDSSYAFTEEGAEAARELGRRCRILESQDKPVNTTTAIWKWREGEEAQRLGN